VNFGKERKKRTLNGVRVKKRGALDIEKGKNMKGMVLNSLRKQKNNSISEGGHKGGGPHGKCRPVARKGDLGKGEGKLRSVARAWSSRGDFVSLSAETNRKKKNQ